MPELEYFLVSEYASIDRVTDSVSLFNILGEIRFQSFPASIPAVVLSTAWIWSTEEIAAREKSHVQFVFKVPGVDDNRTFRSQIEASSRINHMQLRIENIPVHQVGELKIELFLNESRKAGHTLFISSDEVSQ